MAYSGSTTSSLSGELIKYLEKRFLKRSRNAIVFGEGAKKQTLPVNSGTTITWNRYSQLAVATTALTEGTNPGNVVPTGTQVSTTIAQYGNVLPVTDLLFVTSIDREAKEKTDLAAQNMAETIDTLNRNELATGATVQLANGRAALTNITSTDVLTSTEIKRARRTLRKNNAIVYDDGCFLAKVGPDTSFDLVNDSVWLAVSEYGDSAKSAIFNQEIGKLFQVRFIEATANQYNESSTVTVYSNFVHGQEAFGCVDLDSLPNGLIIKQSDSGDTSNPLSLFMTIGWKAAYAVKTLNASWLIDIKSAASA
jgi:N4-gp56 family major capsid protein